MTRDPAGRGHRLVTAVGTSAVVIVLALILVVLSPAFLKPSNDFTGPIVFDGQVTQASMAGWLTCLMASCAYVGLPLGLAAISGGPSVRVLPVLGIKALAVTLAVTFLLIAYLGGLVIRFETPFWEARSIAANAAQIVWMLPVAFAAAGLGAFSLRRLRAAPVPIRIGVAAAFTLATPLILTGVLVAIVVTL